MNFSAKHVSLFALLVSVPLSSAEGPSPEVPELKALDHYAGSWDVVITGGGSPFSKGEVNATWILDGRYLQQIGTLQSADGKQTLKYTALMTYDPQRNTYRAWTFLSDGYTGEARSTWDAKAKVMTSITPNEGSTTTTTADFSEAGTEKWRIVARDAAGNVVFEMAGKNTRRPK